MRVTIIFVLSRKLFDKRIEQDIECDTKAWFILCINLVKETLMNPQKTIGCQRMCHNFFIPMTLSRFWMYHLMAVAAVTVVFSAYKRKKYQDIYEASAILELKKELEEMYPHHYTKPTLVHTVVTGTCTAIANQAVQTAYSFDERISDTPPRLFLFYYLHVWILLARDLL